MRKEDLKVGVHVWFKESYCCGSFHEKGEEGIIIHIDNEDSFLVETINGKIFYWHGLECVTTVNGNFLSDELFEV